jgi:molybdopterin-guanine dinucleotide biosynthesis protein A
MSRVRVPSLAPFDFPGGRSPAGRGPRIGCAAWGFRPPGRRRVAARTCAAEIGGRRCERLANGAWFAATMPGARAAILAAPDAPACPDAMAPDAQGLGRIVALILAGGEGRRMGGADKPLLRVGEQTMLHRIITALRPLPVAISANGDPTRFSDFGAPMLADGPFAGQGPLAGLLAGLDWAATLGVETLLTVPGDTPFVPVGLAAALAPAPACAASGRHVHHLVALWPVACGAALRTWLSVPGPRSIAGFATSIGVRKVDFPVRAGDPFFNVNTPEELAAACRRVDAASAGSEESGW